MGTLGTMVVKLVAETGQFTDAMEKSANKAKEVAEGIGNALKAIDKFAMQAAVGGIKAIGDAIGTSIEKYTEWGDTLDSLGDVLGTDVDQSAGLAVAIRGVGGDVDAITGQMAKLVNGLENSKGELSTSGMAMANLGLSFRETNGEMRPAIDMLVDIADKLSVMPDGLEKTAIMTDLFGKSGKDLSDTMNALANGGFMAAADKADAFGLSLNSTGVNSAIAFKKSLADLQMMGDGLAVTFGGELMPIIVPLLQKFTDFAQKHMPEIRQAIKNVVDFVETSLIPLFEKMAPVLSNPIFAAQKIIIQSVLTAEKFVTDMINGMIIGVNNFTNDLAAKLGVANDLLIPLLQSRTINFGTNGGFAYGTGGAGEVTPPASGGSGLVHSQSVTPSNSVQMGGINIYLAAGQTEQQGAQAAESFIRVARAQGLIVV